MKYFLFFILIFTPIITLAEIETTQQSISIKKTALNTYCTLAPFLGGDTEYCSTQAKDENITISQPAISERIREVIIPVASAQTNPSELETLIRRIVAELLPQPQTIIIQGEKGEKGDKGDPGTPSGSSVPGQLQAFSNIPMPFWNGAGASGGAVSGGGTTVVNNYFSTTTPTTTPMEMLAQNGLSFATTSTSTTIALGGALLSDTTINQGVFNLVANRNGFSVLNQGTTTIPSVSPFLPVSRFVGFEAIEGVTSLHAGIQRRSAPAYPIFEIQNHNTATQDRGFLGIFHTSAQLGYTNGTTTTQVFASGGRLRLSSVVNGASSSQITVGTNGTISFGFDADAISPSTFTYSFPRSGVASGTILGFNDNTKQLKFLTPAQLGITSGTPGWSLTGNAGTVPGVNFIGTTDNQDLVFKTNNATTGVISADGSRILFGVGAGQNATNALSSNFFGVFTGRNAINAYYSNFFGGLAGDNATNASHSNFFGIFAGRDAVNARGSNFFGQSAGIGATDASDSNFFGQDAGSGATNAYLSNFIGLSAGSGATNAHYSNFFGREAGVAAENAYDSNFFGRGAGQAAINASNSIFIGKNAGYGDTVDNASNPTKSSILIGDSTNTGGFSDSIALGASGVNTASNQFLIAPAYTQFNMRGVNYFMPASQGATGTVLRNDGAGNLTWVLPSSFATTTATATMLVTNGLSLYSGSAGLGGILSTTTLITQGNFNFSSVRTPSWDTTRTFSLENTQRTVPLNPAFTSYNIDHAGVFGTKNFAIPTDIGFSQFALGNAIYRAGMMAGVGENRVPHFDAYNYIPLSDSTVDTHRIYNSNYGPAMYYIKYSGAGTTQLRSYMQTRNDGGLYGVGSNVASSSRSDFEFRPNGTMLIRSYNFGSTQATYESDFRTGIWMQHVSPGFSTRFAIGTSTGITVTDGANVYSLPRNGVASGTVMGFNDASGQLKFLPVWSLSVATGTAQTLQFNNNGVLGSAQNMFWDSANSRLGLGTNSPLFLLHVGSSSILSGTPVARFENAGGTCDVTPNVAGGITCTSDQNLKKDIESIDPIENLTKLLAVDVKTYRMNADTSTSTKQTGFLAQQLETQFPGLVLTSIEGTKSVSYAGMTPILTQAIQTLYKFLGDIGVVVEGGVARIGDFFANRIYTKELCIGERGQETCITQAQLNTMLQLQSQSGSSGTSENVSDVTLSTNADTPVDNSPLTPTPPPDILNPGESVSSDTISNSLDLVLQDQSMIDTTTIE